MWILLSLEIVNSWSYQAGPSTGTAGNTAAAISGTSSTGQSRGSPVTPRCLLNTKADRSYHLRSHLLCLHLGGSTYCIPGTILSSLVTYPPRYLPMNYR